MGNGAMGGDTGGLRAEIREILLNAGFAAVGFAEAGPVERSAAEIFARWLREGGNAGMAFMQNHREIREDTRKLLDGAKSIITLAYSYHLPPLRDSRLPVISGYAFLPDYHDLLRNLIRKSGIAELLGEEGKDWRICVDSAPVMERYWAAKSGLGEICDNGMLALPGVGSEFFLAEIITTADLGTETGEPVEGLCLHCGKCTSACPTGALQRDGTVDCDRCLSYLTIEHRGEWTKPEHREAMETAAGRNTLFGCDRCISACPLNDMPRTHLNAASADLNAAESILKEIVDLSAADILSSNEQALKRRLKGTSLNRAKPAGLLRNAQNCSTSIS